MAIIVELVHLVKIEMFMKKLGIIDADQATDIIATKTIG